MAAKAFIATVYGIVQGVGFRYHTRKTAAALNLVGTVQNLRSGEVEVIAEGDEIALGQLVAWLSRGPAPARVARTTVTWYAATGKFDDFHIIG